MFRAAKDGDLIPAFDPLNLGILKAKDQEGVDVDELAVGAVLEVETGHHTYLMENFGKGNVRISGHPKYCPEPVMVIYHGATGDAPMIRMSFIGRGMRMEFQHPTLGVIRTSRVQDIRQVIPAAVVH